jgi:hypothetical protein
MISGKALRSLFHLYSACPFLKACIIISCCFSSGRLSHPDRTLHRPQKCPHNNTPSLSIHPASGREYPTSTSPRERSRPWQETYIYFTRSHPSEEAPYSSLHFLLLSFSLSIFLSSLCRLRFIHSFPRSFIHLTCLTSAGTRRPPACLPADFVSLRSNNPQRVDGK